LYNEIERIFDYAKDVAEIKMRNAYPDLVITGQRKQVRANRQQAGALNDVSNLLSNTNK
jgi:Asp-tRNA(Asn)/Glu-tRNA(Gln) amidotransferase C subunit